MSPAQTLQTSGQASAWGTVTGGVLGSLEKLGMGDPQLGHTPGLANTPFNLFQGRLPDVGPSVGLPMLS